MRKKTFQKVIVMEFSNHEANILNGINTLMDMQQSFYTHPQKVFNYRNQLPQKQNLVEMVCKI